MLKSWCNSKFSKLLLVIIIMLVCVFVVTSVGQSSIYGDFLAIIAGDSQQEEREQTDSEVRTREGQTMRSGYSCVWSCYVACMGVYPLQRTLTTEHSTTTIINVIRLRQNWNYKINKGTTQLYHYQDCILKQSYSVYYYYRYISPLYKIGGIKSKTRSRSRSIHEVQCSCIVLQDLMHE